MAKLDDSYVVTACFTDDGAPAYLTEARTWSRSLDEAVVVDNQQAVDDLLALARSQEALVCDPYAMKARRTSAGTEPLSARESIRSAGPTTPIRRADPS